MNKDQKIEEILNSFQKKFFKKLYGEGSTTSFDWYLNDTDSDDDHLTIEDILYSMKRFIKDALSEMYESKQISDKKITKEQIKKLLEEAYQKGWDSVTYMKMDHVNNRKKDLEELKKHV